MSAHEFYLVEKKPPVAWIFLNRPEKRNALNLPAWNEMGPLCEDLDQDPRVRVVVLSGKGSCFCAGIDLLSMVGEMPELAEQTQQGHAKWRLMKRLAASQDAMTCLERCRKPVIAAIHGHCIGAGLDMAAACDIRICSADARFCLKEAAMGVAADVGVLQRLPLIVGQGITRELAFTAKTITAAQAREILLVNAVYATHDDLMAAANAMALDIAANSPLAVQATKKVLNFGATQGTDRGLQYVAAVSAGILPSTDLKEAVAAFMENRTPRFEDI